MSQFGQTLFGESRFIRWTLTPFLILIAIVALLPADRWSVARVAVSAGLVVASLGLLAGYWIPGRIGRCGFRVVAATVFLVYSAYFADELLFSDAPFRVIEDGGVSSPLNALLGYVIIGIPSLWYTMLGRFSLRAPAPESQDGGTEDADTCRGDVRPR